MEFKNNFFSLLMNNDSLYSKVNMLRRFTQLFLTIMIFNTALSAQQLKLSLNDAVSIALEKNDKVKQYQEKLAQKEFDEYSSIGNFLPTINFDLSYTHLNKNMDIDLSPIRDVIIALQSSNTAELKNIGSILGGTGALGDATKSAIKSQTASYLDGIIPAFTETFKKQDYKTGTFTAIQPIFLGGKLLAAKKYASAEKEASSFEFQKTKNEVISETVANYMRVLLMNEVVKTRTDVLNGMKKHREDAKKLFDEGLIANHHFLRAEVAVAEAERNLSNDENNLAIAKLALAHSMGLDDTTEFELADSLVFKTQSDSLAFFKQTADDNQPILKMLEQKRVSSEQNYNVARSSFLPQIGAFGKYEIYPEYLSSLEPRWAVGLQLKFNIFNGFKDYLKLQSAAHLEEEVKYLEADTKRKINLWVNKAYLDVNNAQTRYEKLKATTELAAENLRQNEKRFQTGLGTSLEVIDAQLSYEKVEVEKFTSLFQYYVSLTDLYQATGNPSEVLKVWSNQEITK
jgi:outer membrane protein TolC